MTRRAMLGGAAVLAACSRTREPLPVFNTIPEFTLTDQHGNPFAFASQLKGKVWVADFIFTTCQGPCPRMSRQMKQVQAGLEGAAGARLVSFTVDPENDTPPALAEYAKRYQAAAGRWFFLTGPKETLHQLKREAFMLGNVEGSTDHSTRFVLIDRQGRVRRYYDTSESDAVTRVITDARRLLNGERS